MSYTAWALGCELQLFFIGSLVVDCGMHAEQALRKKIK
jgi:hypothetical protein